jgi:hypothetical protein
MKTKEQNISTTTQLAGNFKRERPTIFTSPLTDEKYRLKPARTKAKRSKAEKSGSYQNLHPNLIRTWFDTVLNPIIRELKTELYCINNGNITWRFFRSYFEYLKPMHTMINYKFNDNFEQCIIYIDGLLEIINTHDDALEKLRNVSNNLYSAIINSPQLSDTYNKNLDFYLKKHPDIDDQFEKELRSDNTLRFIAEYIINNREELDSAYILSPFWNEYSKDFISVLNDKNFSVEKRNFTKVFQKFKDIVGVSLNEIKRIRDILSIRYGEPLVRNTQTTD